MPTLTVIMPVFNERATVPTAIEHLLDAELPVDELELVVVDDGSVDGTREWLRSQDWPRGVVLLERERNAGKGAAVRDGIAQASGEFCTILDADLEYDAQSIATLLEAAVRDEGQAIYGVRGFESHSTYGFWYVLGNYGVSFAANILFNSWLSDIMTCHKLMRTDLLRSLRLRENGFAIEAEITARLLGAGIRIYEVPITYRARGREEGKKLTALDGLRVLRTLVRCRLRG